MNADREQLERYFRDSAATQDRLRQTKESDSALRRIAKHGVPVRLRGTARMVITNAVMPRERKKAEALAADTSGPLRLHLGSGGEHKDGWVNVDLVGDPIDLAWNLAKGIPFEDGRVDAIFHEHLLEHIPMEDGYGFMQECFRVLRPGGVLRVGVPDAGMLCASYVGDGRYLEELHPGRPTRLIAVQELFYWHRHTTMFDKETLGLVFRAAGFPDPVQKEFGDSAVQPAPDTERRRAESLYMEAIKPA